MKSKSNYIESRETLLKLLEEDTIKLHDLIKENDIKLFIQNFDIYKEELTAQNEELIVQEKKLYESVEKYKNLFDFAPVAYVEIDHQSNILNYNKKAIEFFGDENISHKRSLKYNVFIDKSSFGSYIVMLNDIKVKYKESIQKQLIYKIAGKQYHGLTAISRDITNKTFLISIKDVTDDVEQQHILMTQSKIASVGEMIANIAHQWRQPLSIITTLVSSMKLSINLGEKIESKDIEECADSVLTQSAYLSDTIDNFREFFASDIKTKEKYNLKEVMLKLQGLVKATMDSNFIKCHFIAEEKIEVMINATLLLQAFINICNNAKDALVEKNSDDHRYFFVTLVQVNKNIQIVFKDNAGGINENIIDEIFKPYFTTKHASIGTGIGLYMTHQIITKHFQGSIEVKNVEYTYNGEKFKGAQFTIIIPQD